ncbi:HAMP domain-containing histidine kinase [Marivirga sp. S37H4]|uniref:histidine kinase n=1 Tax=Marivirga aurantiaca TaxID=2802615 RepID=A0A934X1T6_9BACT|nr:HAMP domain-containing sensor histidine kinase [Marivirga aurantiaca]MBK6266820.1 HAMP domain-containing histidine kinase [Marivirga aurantiaca]
MNHASDIVAENDMHKLLQMIQLSSPALYHGEIGLALKSLLKFLEESFNSKESWIIQQDKDDLSLLWNLDNPLVKEEVLLGDKICKKIDKTFFHIEIEKPFLIHQHHLVFPFEYNGINIWVGFSAPKPIELDNGAKLYWELIAERLRELCTCYLQMTSRKEESMRFETIFDQMPQSIVFSEEENGPTLLNKEALKLFELSSGQSVISFELFSQKFAHLKDKVINKAEVDLMGKNMFSLGGAFPSSFGEDWIWKFENKVLKVIRKNARINGKKGDLWVFDNVSELYYANERLNALFRTLNVAYDEINANLSEFQSKSTGKKSITDLEAEESRIIQQYDNNDIFGKVTHDLRTPFAKVYTIVQLLLTDHQENLSEQQVERINLIKQVVADGLQIVKGFLDTGNMVLDEQKYKPETVDLHSLIDECLVPYELLSARKNIIFITQILGKNMQLEVDRTYLKRIIDNLVSNAIKFSPFGTQINYTVTREGDNIIFSVKDQGPGLTEDDKNRLFKKYQQLSAKPIGTDESTGLGLYIVKSMVDKMGGKIWVESEHGKGSNFIVSFFSSQT